MFETVVKMTPGMPKIRKRVLEGPMPDSSLLLMCGLEGTGRIVLLLAIHVKDVEKVPES